MTSALSTSQGLLTRASNRLKGLLADNSDLLQADLHFSIDNDVQRRQTGELRRKLRRATAAIKAATSKVEEALYKYSNTAEQLDENTPSIPELAKQITENSEAAQALLDQANKPTPSSHEGQQVVSELWKKGHMAAGCLCGACRLCGTSGHHTSICKKLYETTEIPRTPPATKPTKKPASKSTTQASTISASAKVNSVVFDQVHSEISDTILHVNDNAGSLILVGRVQLLNPTTAALEPVHTMLDTGADRSFISTELAERLQLKDVDSKRLSISTFGSNTPMVKRCGITVLKVWDANGAPHSFSVTKIDKITDTLQRNNLCLGDKRFLCDNDIQLSIEERRNPDEEEDHGGPQARYNLRLRARRITSRPSFLHLTTTSILPLLMTILLAHNAIATQTTTTSSPIQGHLTCVSGGVHLTSHNVRRYELCAENHCQVKDNPQANETVLFPPEVTLHQHHVQWKLSNGEFITMLDTVCPPVSFCDNVRCWFCTANVFKPECSPHTAIVVSAIVLYITIAVI
ncbi:hypothetical protein GCK32_015166 [Trichostrongylus colubriformis]|uniref:DUF1758 domain-containing protein n=1 Tax=Trichostrongylus colubriformis TaxID=6319 RepID=A0AAN8FG70_TRICO